MTTFDAPLWETMRLVRGTDVFLGMHGAGFTNVLWLQQVRAPHNGHGSSKPPFCNTTLDPQMSCPVLRSTYSLEHCRGDADMTLTGRQQPAKTL